MSSILVKEIECKSILCKSGLADYALNCYTGCQHGCLYCYARFMGRFTGDILPWGSFVYVKANALDVLKKQVRKAKKGNVFISSVCDGWQPPEGKYKLTRQCLEVLLENDFSVTILTKNTLILRDFDVLSSKKTLVHLGMTVTTLKDKLARDIEPGAPLPQKRLKILEEAGNLGITIYAFLGPLMPYLSDSEEDIDALFKAIKPLNLAYIYIDALNPRWGVWPSVKALLLHKYPSLVEKYQNILFHNPTRIAYLENFKLVIQKLASHYGILDKLKFC